MKPILLLCASIFLYHISVFASSAEVGSHLVSRNEFHTLDSSKTASFKIDKKKGEFAMASFFGEPSELQWAKQFGIVELGGVDDKRMSYKNIEKAGLLSIEHRLGYDWMPAFYYYLSGENRSIVDWLYRNKKSTTLNPNGPFLHCEENHYDWCHDYYYNLGNQEVFNKKIEQLQADMKSSGLNGLFFDWADGGYIDEAKHKTILDNFKRLNPHKNYYEIVGDLYKKLKELGIFFITNQAFRQEEYLLPHVKYDMTESYITSTKDEKRSIQIEGKGWVENIQTTNYFPIYTNSKTIDDSIKYIDLLTTYKQKYKNDGFMNFIYLNYLGPKYEALYPSSKVYRLSEPKNGIYYGYAMGKLTDNIVYAQVLYDAKLEKDDIYFYDLGKPLGKSYEKVGAVHGYIRFFTKGFVLVSSPYTGERYLKISSKWLDKKSLIYDAYTKSWIKGFRGGVTVKLEYEKDGLDNMPLPLGRVYLYKD